MYLCVDLMDTKMNDFTREELIDIKRLFRVADVWFNGMDELRDKIQSMINNYCEHQGDGLIYWSNPPQSKCAKCGKYFR